MQYLTFYASCYQELVSTEVTNFTFITVNGMEHEKAHEICHVFSHETNQAYYEFKIFVESIVSMESVQFKYLFDHNTPEFDNSGKQ